MARVQTPSETVSLAVKMRTEGMGVRATGRVLEKSQASISNWERRVVEVAAAWNPPARTGGDITVAGDEVSTRVSENFPPRIV